MCQRRIRNRILTRHNLLLFVLLPAPLWPLPLPLPLLLLLLLLLLLQSLVAVLLLLN